MASKEKLKLFHTVCGQCGLTKENKLDLLSGYGVESSKDLDDWQVVEIVNKLKSSGENTRQVQVCEVKTPDTCNSVEMDIWRKRVLAAVCGWLKATGREQSIEYAKKIACRAVKKDWFNRITESELRKIYNEFVRKAEIKDNTEEVIGDLVGTQMIYN
jgi:ribonuclease HIII